MYLRAIHIRNSGPLRSLDLSFELDHSGLPLTYALLGPNGSGKTNALSLIADALVEGAAGAFQDVVPSQGISRSWFRLVGANTITYGEKGGFSILKFESGSTPYFYVEKAGSFPATEARQSLTEEVASAATWPDSSENIKSFVLPDPLAQETFRAGAYAYFPSSRAERPHWLNMESIKEDRFQTNATIGNQLRKPIFVERGIEEFGQWLMGVISDARVDIAPLISGVQNAATDDKIDPRKLLENVGAAVRDLNGYLAANNIIQLVLGDPQARFVWAGRHYAKKIAIESRQSLFTLDGLSAGQASLLSIFGTLLRYGDSQQFKHPSEIEGICIVDEIDAHMHADLQLDALPQLIKAFPKIQFLLSGHSPLFVLGLHRHLGERAKFIEMPTGVDISPEAYGEFARALEAFKGTQAVADLIARDTATLIKPKVLFEGETDPEYFSTAARILGFEMLLQSVDFEWVGAKDPERGQGFNTGKAALDRAYALLRAKPNLIPQQIVLLYDSDTNKVDSDHGNLHVRVIPRNLLNKVADKGVENLLPEVVFSDEMYDTSTKQRDYGGSVITRELNKMRLCKSICDKPDESHFEGFRSVLETLRDIFIPVSVAASSAE